MNSELRVCPILSSPLRDVNGADFHELLGILHRTRTRFDDIRNGRYLHPMVVHTGKGVVAGMGTEGRGNLPYIDLALVDSELKFYLPGVDNFTHYLGHGIMRYYLDERIEDRPGEPESGPEDGEIGAPEQGTNQSFRTFRSFRHESPFSISSTPPETDPTPSLDSSPTGGLIYPPEPLRAPEVHAALDYHSAPANIPFGLPPTGPPSLVSPNTQSAAPAEEFIRALVELQAAKDREENKSSATPEGENLVEEGRQLGRSDSAGSSCPSLESIASDEIDVLVFGLGHLCEGTLEKIIELYGNAGIAIPPPDTTYKIESMLALLTPTILDKIRRTAADSDATSAASSSNDSMPRIVMPVTPPSPDTRSRIEAYIAARNGSDADVSDTQSTMSPASSREYKTAMEVDEQDESDEERDYEPAEALDQQIREVPSRFDNDHAYLVNPQISLPGFRAQADGSARANLLTYPHSFMGLKATTFITSELRDHFLVPDLIALADSPFHPSALGTYYYWRGLCRMVVLSMRNNVALIRRHFDRGNPELQEALNHPALKLIREYAGTPEAPLSPLFRDSESKFLLITADFFRSQRRFEYASALVQLVSTHFADDTLIRNVIKSGLVDGLQLPMLAKLYDREFGEWYDIVKEYLIDERTILGEDDD